MNKKRLSPLPDREILAILRAADDLIAQGGRTLLAKVLKGSRERKLLELGLDRNPSYGYFKALTVDEITEKVDHMIRTGYLDTDGDRKFPLLVFTPLGWWIEKERRADEFLREWDVWIAGKVSPMNMEYLKERNRGMMFLFLYKVLLSRDKKYIPFLNLWASIDFKKVQAEIRHVVKALTDSDKMDGPTWQRLLGERAKDLLIPSKEPIFLACRHCGRVFILRDTNPEYYTNEGLKLPEKCPTCEAG